MTLQTPAWVPAAQEVCQQLYHLLGDEGKDSLPNPPLLGLTALYPAAKAALFLTKHFGFSYSALASLERVLGYLKGTAAPG